MMQKNLEAIVIELLRKAVTDLPKDVEAALRKAYKKEKGKIARMQLENILKNVELARRKKIPMCQDTGLPVFFIKFGSKYAGINFEEVLEEVVKKATTKIPLRPNAVDPITRKNSGDNTGLNMPVVHYELVNDEDFLEITVMTKGTGSENKSALGILLPTSGVEGIKNFVLETVKKAGSDPCPPIIVGVGIGSNADGAMLLAKKALLRKLDEKNKNKKIADLEEKLLGDINKLGIGPMGLGGNTTALAVQIEIGATHTGSLPVAVNIQCWADRRATAKLENGKWNVR